MSINGESVEVPPAQRAALGEYTVINDENTVRLTGGGLPGSPCATLGTTLMGVVREP